MMKLFAIPVYLPVLIVCFVAASATGEDSEPPYATLKKSILENDTTLFPPLDVLYSDVSGLVVELKGWLESEPLFKEPTPRLVVYKVLRNKPVVSTSDGAAVVLEGLKEPDETIRVICALGLINAPRDMRAGVREAIQQMFSEKPVSEEARRLIEREHRWAQVAAPVVPMNPIETAVWNVLSSQLFDDGVFSDVIKSHGRNDVLSMVLEFLDRDPPVLDAPAKIHAYTALAAAAFQGNEKSILKLTHGMKSDEADVQIVCARGLASMLDERPDLVLTGVVGYFESAHPNKEAEMLVMEKLLPGEDRISLRLAQVISGHLELFPTDPMHSAYCALLMLTGMNTDAAVDKFEQVQDARIVKGIGRGIALGPARFPRAEGQPEVDFARLRRYVVSLIRHDNPLFREAGLVAGWSVLGASPNARTPEQAAANKEVLSAVLHASVRENSPAATRSIQVYKAGFETSGFLKSKKEIRESISN